MFEKKLEKMRPCVKSAFIEGASDKDHQKKMTYAIIFELNRLGIEKSEIKMALLDWNKKSYRVLSQGDANRQLCDFVDWFFKKKECKLGCKALDDYCLYPSSRCVFRTPANGQDITPPFSIPDAIIFLEKEYRPQGYLMGLLVQSLIKIQKEKNAKSIIFVGLRSLQARLMDNDRHNMDLMSILRALNDLEKAGLIRITHGQSGTFGTRHANGYMFLPWTPPKPIITHLCNKSEIQ